MCVLVLLQTPTRAIRMNGSVPTVDVSGLDGDVMVIWIALMDPMKPIVSSLQRLFSLFSHNVI